MPLDARRGPCAASGLIPGAAARRKDARATPAGAATRLHLVRVSLSSTRAARYGAGARAVLLARDVSSARAPEETIERRSGRARSTRWDAPGASSCCSSGSLCASRGGPHRRPAAAAFGARGSAAGAYGPPAPRPRRRSCRRSRSRSGSGSYGSAGCAAPGDSLFREAWITRAVTTALAGVDGRAARRARRHAPHPCPRGRSSRTRGRTGMSRPTRRIPGPTPWRRPRPALLWSTGPPAESRSSRDRPRGACPQRCC